MRAGHPQSLQNLDFAKQAPRPPLASAGEEEEEGDREASAASEQHIHQQPARPQSAVGRSTPVGYACHLQQAYTTAVTLSSKLQDWHALPMCCCSSHVKPAQISQGNHLKAN